MGTPTFTPAFIPPNPLVGPLPQGEYERHGWVPIFAALPVALFRWRAKVGHEIE